MNVLKALKEVKELMEDCESKKVIKTIPMKKEWKRMYDESTQLKEELTLLQAKFDSKRNLMWATIEEDLGEYGQMRVGDDKETIELIAE